MQENKDLTQVFIRKSATIWLLPRVCSLARTVPGEVSLGQQLTGLRVAQGGRPPGPRAPWRRPSPGRAEDPRGCGAAAALVPEGGARRGSDCVSLFPRSCLRTCHLGNELSPGEVCLKELSERRWLEAEFLPLPWVVTEGGRPPRPASPDAVSLLENRTSGTAGTLV